MIFNGGVAGACFSFSLFFGGQVEGCRPNVFAFVCCLSRGLALAVQSVRGSGKMELVLLDVIAEAYVCCMGFVCGVKFVSQDRILQKPCGSDCRRSAGLGRKVRTRSHGKAGRGRAGSPVLQSNSCGGHVQPRDIINCVQRRPQHPFSTASLRVSLQYHCAHRVQTFEMLAGLGPTGGLANHVHIAAAYLL